VPVLENRTVQYWFGKSAVCLAPELQKYGGKSEVAGNRKGELCLPANIEPNSLSEHRGDPTGPTERSKLLLASSFLWRPELMAAKAHRLLCVDDRFESNPTSQAHHYG